MTKTKTLVAILATTSMLGGVAFANEGAMAPHPVSAAQRAADQDVGKLSKDGAQAFRDLHLARLAIYNADPTQAKELIGKAQAAFAKAKTDDAVYMKAESALKGAAAKPAAATASAATPAPAAAASTPAAATSAPATTPAAQPTAWLPVDGQLTLGEDFLATPAKTSAVADANKSLEKGDRKAAIEKLKLADVDVNFVLAVVPLTQTTSDVDQAATLISQGKYYEANAALKKAEDGLRFDVVDVVGLPKAAAKAPASTPAQPPKAAN
ncbi:YfdX family protein [Methylobacterium sp. J-068]|uniref:YfdX family protein n=1 Tax=Methylobacterium sp. J-068 TaxID=2836649 RepID=UPI001FBAEECC|nr:YfdX family protein [Methylobacterium sp. J-068]MCJ2034642.1 YfdX family protein [Methylobacterium sp. J-068]